MTERDLELFFEHQLDDEANAMAAFAARGREDFNAHWRKILADENVVVRTILLDGNIAGNVVSWPVDGGERDVGYWIGKPYWGKGVATAALSQFLQQVETRPLYAHVAKANRGSLRVLEKCGFVVSREVNDGDLDELVMVFA